MLVLLAVPAARSADGLDALAQVVTRACDCAAGQASGMDAAIRCTGGPDAFGRVKVAHRGAWGEAQRARAAELERVIETCLSNAMDADAAREHLGLPAAIGGAGLSPARWRRVAPSALADHPTSLVRIDHGKGAPIKGMVEGIDAGSVVLRRARRDGGGVERLPLDAIRGAWVMELTEP